MSSASDHYRSLLAPIYLWMAGGADNALAAGAADLKLLGVATSAGDSALDLGAGFGMHAITLARLGYRVTAMDSSPELLRELGRLGEGLGVRALLGDLLDFEANIATPPVLILCMGDTLTHLESIADVKRLCSCIAAALAPGGRFVTTFRDYTNPAVADSRFIPVRSDANRIHTCFLEQQGDRILVHDIVHERQAIGSWTMQVSHYPKLRLDPEMVVRALETSGMQVARTCGPRGMAQISALKPGAARDASPL